jgi:peptidoglycan/xylan/chitin deacetylase (PgdA/CDA1 family)
MVYDVEMTEDTLKKLVADKQNRWFRFGCGLFSLEKIIALSEKGFKTVLGDTYSFDAHIPFPFWVALHTIIKVRPGSIVIMHDGTWWRGVSTSTALDIILPVLKCRGYSFRTLSELDRRQ